MTEHSKAAPKNFFLTWRYIQFWIASLLSNMGTWMQQIAQPWVVLSLSNSAFWVGLDSFALNVPGLLFTIVGGILADRFDRRRVVIFFQVIQFVCVVLLVFLLAAGWLKVWMIVCISFMVGLTDALSNPAFQTIVPSLVRPEEIPRAVSLNSTQFNLSRILGPAVAGVVIARYGAVACFGANAASYVPYFIALYFIYPRNRAKMPAEPIQAKPVDELSEIRKLIVIPEVRLPLMMVLVTNLFCGPLVTFCPVIIKNVFHSGVGDFGWAIAAFGSGGVIGAVGSFIPVSRMFKRKVAFAASLLLGLVVIAIALNHSLVLLLALLVVAGTALTTANIAVNIFLQETATNNIRGRVASLYQLSLYGGISIGGLLTGFVVSGLGVSTALLINGALAFVLQLCLLWAQVYGLKTNKMVTQKNIIER